MALAFGRVAKAFDLFFKRDVARAADKSGSGRKKPIRGIVVYYSGSGNTAKIAGAIHTGIKSVIPCDIAPLAPAIMKKVKPEDLSKYDLVAFGSPNWFHREVANLKHFTTDMPRMDGKHCVLFCTHGGQPISQFWSMSHNVLKKGMTIIGWNEWYGPDVLPRGGPDMHVHMATGHPDSIDLIEAEAFGRQMAEHSIRIYSGERDLIPRIPTPSMGEASLWAPQELNNRVAFAFPPPESLPEFDFTKCVYPRCTRCIDNCPMNAIDFSTVTMPVGSTDTPIVLKEGCSACGGLCERMCLYDAVAYIGEKFYHKIDMTKCTYPECTACVDWCPADCIDFSTNPPVFHNHCETCNICYGVCPEDAVIITNPDHKGQWWRVRSEPYRTPLLKKAIEKAEGPTMAWFMGSQSLPKFRPQITQEEQRKGATYTDLPRLKFKKEDWPCEIDEG
jgi:ferredoxin/flavodoxin